MRTDPDGPDLVPRWRCPDDRIRLFMYRYVLFVTVSLLAVACGSSSASSPSPTAPTSTLTPPPGATAAMVTEGQSLFNTGSCALCHGVNGRDPSRGPNLTDKTYLHNSGDYEEIVQIITSGVPAANFKLLTSQAQFEMFPRGGMNFTDAQIRAIAAYVWALSHSS
jgi:mono/diheme cytochrome c family protein